VTAEPAQLDTVLRALADGTRRTILDVVRDHPRAVGEIAQGVSMSQQAVSHHLRVLRGADLVTETRDGTRHLFVARTEGFDVVQQFIRGFWPNQLAALKAAAEKTARENG
jgi:DNA-binding transcriptional ArsR family regulator